MDGGERQDETGGRGRGRGDRLVDLAGRQRLDDGAAAFTDLDTGGGITKDGAVLLGEGEQRPEPAEGIGAA